MATPITFLNSLSIRLVCLEAHSFTLVTFVVLLFVHIVHEKKNAYMLFHIIERRWNGARFWDFHISVTYYKPLMIHGESFLVTMWLVIPYHSRPRRVFHLFSLYHITRNKTYLYKFSLEWIPRLNDRTTKNDYCVWGSDFYLYHLYLFVLFPSQKSNTLWQSLESVESESHPHTLSIQAVVRCNI